MARRKGPKAQRSRTAVEAARQAVQSTGARCDVCPLGPMGVEGASWAPVLPENIEKPWLLLAQAPGPTETAVGRPLCGPFGATMTTALARAGLQRPQAAWDNVVACEPPGGDYKRFTARLRAQNRRRKREGKPAYPDPAACCRPRLDRVLEGKQGVLPIGKEAAAAVLGGSPKIMDIRGTILEKNGVKVAPTIASFQHKRRWIRILMRDVKRAVAYFSGTLSWTDPHIHITTDPQEIHRWLVRTRESGKGLGAGLRAWDLETDGIHPTRCKIRCIGFGTTAEALVIPVHDLDGAPFMSFQTQAYLAERLEQEWALEHPWVGHNSGYFDKLVIESWSERLIGRRIFPKVHHDTVLMAAVVNAEHPKTLAFCATVFSEEGTPAWKADHKATDARSFRELAVYCGMDNAIQRRITPAMMRAVTEHNGHAIYNRLRDFQEVCAEFHRLGMPIRVDKAQAMAQECQEQEQQALQDVMDALQATGTEVEGYGTAKRKGDPCLFNPNSAEHVRDLLFVRWGFLPPAGLSAKDLYTDADEFSTNKKVIMELQYDPQTNDLQREFIRKYLIYKKLSKRRSTVQSLTWRHKTGKVQEVTDDDGRVITRYDEHYGHVWPSHDPKPWGRVHASFSAHGTNVTRPAGSRPNMLNVEKPIRTLFEAPPGMKFVGADWSALHLRLIAAFWGIPRLVEASVNDLDPHALMCGVIYGDEFWRADGHPEGPRGCMGEYTGLAGFMRRPIKAFQYAFVYKAGEVTIHRVMASYMNQDGTRAFPDIAVQDVAAFREKTLEQEPEWNREWNRLLNTWKNQGYIETPLLGRRCYFEDGYVIDGSLTEGDDDPGIGGNVGNGIINFEILGGEGDFASDVTVEFAKEVPPGYRGPGTGLVLQNYDSLLALVPEEDAPRVRDIMQQCMNRTIHGIPMKAQAKIGQTWKEVC